MGEHADSDGIVLPHVYDGVSVWQKPDGTLINRWAKARAKYPEDESVRWRYERTQEWIEGRET